MKVRNVYHCCVQKTGSQWIKSILGDKLIFRNSGLKTYSYQKYLPTKGDPRRITERIFDHPLPENTIATPLYLDYHCYSSIKKPEEYRTFFVFRDPRDITVSWYYSVKYIHPIMGRIQEHRDKLHLLSIAEGLSYCINYLNEYGIFKALESWLDFAEADSYVILIRFEDMIDPEKQLSILSSLFQHCCFELTDRDIERLLKKYRFDLMKKKHSRGGISPYRKGTPKDWKNHFNEDLIAQFKELTGNLVKRMGYEE